MYVNRPTFIYILRNCPNKLNFNNYDRKTLIDMCNILITEYRRINNLYELDKFLKK